MKVQLSRYIHAHVTSTLNVRNDEQNDSSKAKLTDLKVI